MDRRFMIFYKSFSVIRLITALVLSAIIVVDLVNSPRPGGDGSGLQLFSPLEELCIMLFMITFPINSIINALVAFKPRWALPGIFDWKPLFILCYVLEVIPFPYFFYLAWERVQDAFFPPPPDTYLGVMLDFISTDKGDSNEKRAALLVCLLVICSLLFLVFFWKMHRASQRSFLSSS